jgi:DNA-binding transcriptional LysR family regulator
VMDQTFLLPRQGSGTRKILEDLFQGSGIRLKHTIELGTTEGVKKGVEAGLGISIILQHIVLSVSATAQEFLKYLGNNE